MSAEVLSRPANVALRYSKPLLIAMLIGVVFVGEVLLHRHLTQTTDRTAIQQEELGLLLQGQYLRPLLLGYHDLGADALWLRLIQVLGKRTNTAQEYQWLYHAMDVITDLDPQYDYVYQVGGITLAELAHRVDLSNKLLEKGLAANPTVWQIPFYLGFNHFFYLHDPVQAAEYMLRASKLPGRPPYLPLLATRLSAEAGNPEVALKFLGEMERQTQDVQVKEQLETRMRELVVERDVQMLQMAVKRYTQITHHAPRHLGQLVSAGILSALPQEPFGGEYRYNAKSGGIASSTHPERLRVKNPGRLPTVGVLPSH
jgi:hypothetical protein